MPDFYSKEQLSQATEIQLDCMIQQFRQKQFPTWKVAAFVGYNLLFLGGLGFYALSFKGRRLRRGDAPKLQRHELTLSNIMKKGSVHALCLFSVYIAGFSIVGPRTVPLSAFRELTEIQLYQQAFSIRFDPFYQQNILMVKMRKFGISEQLIKEVEDDLKEQYASLVKKGGLRQETSSYLQQAHEWFHKNLGQMSDLESYL